LTQSFSSLPTGSYLSTLNGYFFSTGDVEVPGSGSSTNSASCQWGLYLTWNGLTGYPTSITWDATITDEALVYYYLTGSGSYMPSGSVYAKGTAFSPVQNLSKMATINQTAATQTNTLQSGPTPLSYGLKGYPFWTYDATHMEWNGDLSLYSASTSGTGTLSAPTHGNTKQNEGEGYGEDNINLTGVTAGY
jgi:hypothetical protein